MREILRSVTVVELDLAYEGKNAVTAIAIFRTMAKSATHTTTTS